MRQILYLFLLFTALSWSGKSLADSELPAMLIRIPESITSVFVAETSTAEFHRFVRDGDGMKFSDSYYMSIGQMGAGKERSGDKRTPIGAYFVTEQLDTSKLHEKYGVTAFPLDYPNAWDQRAGRDGDGIWVHGVHPDGGRRPERDTDGCIALTNQDLLTLVAEFRDNVTPVLVTRKVNWTVTPENESIGDELESRISEWVESKTSGDMYSYLSLYDADFVRWEMNKAEWSAVVLQSNAQSKSSDAAAPSAAFSDLLLLGYPAENDIYLSRFRLTTKESDQEITTTTRLYWRRASDGTLRIIAEDRG